MTERSDEDLVARVVAARDAAAFEALVRRYQSKVRNWLRQLTRDAARADDLAQETFIRAWQHAHTFSGAGSFASWIMKIAYNEHLQALRKLAQQGRLANAYGGEQTARSAPDGPADEWPDAARMLAVLSDDERAAMVLSYAHGMSHGEVAEIIGMPLGTVKSHLHRAKAKIRAHFALDGAASDRGATPPRGRLHG